MAENFFVTLCPPLLHSISNCVLGLNNFIFFCLLYYSANNETYFSPFFSMSWSYCHPFPLNRQTAIIPYPLKQGRTWNFKKDLRAKSVNFFLILFKMFSPIMYQRLFQIPYLEWGSNIYVKTSTCWVMQCWVIVKL